MLGKLAIIGCKVQRWMELAQDHVSGKF